MTNFPMHGKVVIYNQILSTLFLLFYTIYTTSYVKLPDVRGDGEELEMDSRGTQDPRTGQSGRPDPEENVLDIQSERTKHEEDMQSGESERYVITRVEHQITKMGTYDLYLNDQYAYTVHEDTLVALQLLKGAILERSDLVRIEREERLYEAFDRAIRWIGRRPHASQEIQHKLRQLEFEEDVIDGVMDRLRSRQLLDDRAFAEEWTEQRIYTQKKGRQWVKYELMQKGISSEDIDAALREVDPEAEYEGALQLGLKKWRQTQGDVRTRKHKTAAYLMRRGFPSDVVRKVVNSCESDEG